METAAETRFFFENFEVDTVRRVLLKNGQNIALNPKAFDLLLALIDKGGETISKSDLLDEVWENQFVEEKNLAVQIVALRKALGESKSENRFIVTVPGKGYKFAAPINQLNKNGLIIETQKIERITIEDEIIEDRKQLPDKKISYQIFAFYLFPLVFLLLLVGYFVWKNTGITKNAPVSVKRLTTNGKVQLAALSPDGKLFGYVTKDLGQTSLWLGYTAGGNNILLRPPSDADFYQLTFSPDSNQLYFSMSDKGNPNPSIYRIPVLGGVAEKIVETHKIFSLSPDGKQIAYRRGGDNGTILMVVSALNGIEEHEILSFPQSQPFIYGSVSWSPDSKRMAFSCQREMFFQDLCLAEISGGNIERIILPNHRSVLKTAWLKSNDGVVVTAIPKENNSSVVNYQILLINQWC